MVASAEFKYYVLFANFVTLLFNILSHTRPAQQGCFLILPLIKADQSLQTSRFCNCPLHWCCLFHLPPQQKIIRPGTRPRAPGRRRFRLSLIVSMSDLGLRFFRLEFALKPELPLVTLAWLDSIDRVQIPGLLGTVDLLDRLNWLAPLDEVVAVLFDSKKLRSFMAAHSSWWLLFFWICDFVSCMKMGEHRRRKSKHGFDATDSILAWRVKMLTGLSPWHESLHQASEVLTPR